KGVLAGAQGWSEGRMRGGESDSANKVAEFLVGVHLVDLYLALSRDNANDALNALSPIITHTPNFLMLPQEAQFYKEAHRQIASGKNPRTFAIEAAQKEASLTKGMAEEGSSYLEFGKWAEAGRLSALARQSTFFQNDETRRFLDWLVRNAEEQDLPTEIVRDLEKIRDLLSEAEPPQFPYDALARRFTSILRYYQGESRSGSSF
ncbi:MAG TPA: hypothetical protein VF179_33170, partial [Thermoanaerobaculia bacterium]|nr:hypothetical protein [Thermoanaerobaculia bacterium]